MRPSHSSRALSFQDDPIEAYYYFVSLLFVCVHQIASRIILSRLSYTAAATATAAKKTVSGSLLLVRVPGIPVRRRRVSVESVATDSLVASHRPAHPLDSSCVCVRVIFKIQQHPPPPIPLLLLFSFLLFLLVFSLFSCPRVKSLFSSSMTTTSTWNRMDWTGMEWNKNK